MKCSSQTKRQLLTYISIRIITQYKIHFYNLHIWLQPASPIVQQLAPINVFCRSKPEAYSELCQTSKMELFTKIVNGFQPLIILQTALSQMFDPNRVQNTPQNRRIHNSHGSRVDFKCALLIRSIVLNFLTKIFQLKKVGFCLKNETVSFKPAFTCYC